MEEAKGEVGKEVEEGGRGIKEVKGDSKGYRRIFKK